MEREDWRATVHRVPESQRPLSMHVETNFHILPRLLYMMANGKYSSDTQPCFFMSMEIWGIYSKGKKKISLHER